MALGREEGALGVRRAARAMERVSPGPWSERQWVSACGGRRQPRSSHRLSAQSRVKRTLKDGDLVNNGASS